MNSDQSTPGPIISNLRYDIVVRSGTYCVVKAGISLSLYYSRPMHVLAKHIEEIVNMYILFIPSGVIQSILSTSGVWRPFTRQSLAGRLRKMSADGVDYRSIHLSSGAPGNVGDYGFHFFGSRFSNPDTSPRETCLLTMKFPPLIATSTSAQEFIQFVLRIAKVEPFDSGHAGYAFNHLFETWRDQALPWIAQKAPRFLGFDINYDLFRRAARGRLVTASWITMIGTSMVEVLGGADALRNALPPEVQALSANGGIVLVEGQWPPVGDVNRGASDLALLRAVANLTKPLRVRSEIGFGSESFRSGWLDRFDQ